MSLDPVVIGESSASFAIPAPTVQPVLQRGSTGPAVTYAQTVLRNKAGQSIDVTGTFDPSTEAAVRNLQQFFGLPKSGIVDAAVYEALALLGTGTVTGATFDITDRVLSLEISLTMDGVSQLSLEVSDDGLELAKANYWNLRRPLTYKGLQFEVAAVELKQGAAGEEIKIEARSAACQRLKRDRQATVFNGGNATSYAAMKAREVGLKFFGEATPPQKNIAQSQGEQTSDSAWDVLKRLAGDNNQFVMFESDGRLFFTSMQFLLGKYAVVGESTTTGFFYTPIYWLTDPGPTTVTQTEIPGPTGTPFLGLNSSGEHVRFVQQVLRERAGQQIEVNGTYGLPTYAAIQNLQRFTGTPVTGTVDVATWSLVRFLAEGRTVANTQFSIKALECPSCRKSDDDFNAATVTFQCELETGRLLRPGMTIKMVDMPDFDTYLLVSEVRWVEGEVGTVSVSARTPLEPQEAKEKAEAAAKIDLTGGQFGSLVVSGTL